MQNNIIKIHKSAHARVSPVRRFETHKATKAGRQTTLARREVRLIKYGSVTA